MEHILEKISKISLKFLQPIDLTQMYSLIVKEAVNLVNADSGGLVLEDKGVLKRSYDMLPDLMVEKIRKKGTTYQCYKEHRTLIATGGPSKKRSHPLSSKVGTKSVVFIPLSHKGKCLGVLIVRFSRLHTFKSRELKTLNLYGSLASLAILKAQSFSEISKALELRDLFISMASHELRTPITTIHGYAQLLSNKFSDRTGIESKWVSDLLAETKHLTVLVDELLTVNRIKSGKLDYILKELNIKEVARRTSLNLKFNYPDRVLVIEDNLHDKQSFVVGDFDKLIQAVDNVLDNAVKYSPSDREIILKMGDNSKYVKIQIQDFGQGIAKKDIPRIFEEFYQLSGNVKGIGLGLYLTKNIIEKHLGKIKVDSKVGFGTTVKIMLPKFKKRET